MGKYLPHESLIWPPSGGEYWRGKGRAADSVRRAVCGERPACFPPRACTNLHVSAPFSPTRPGLRRTHTAAGAHGPRVKGGPQSLVVLAPTGRQSSEPDGRRSPADNWPSFASWPSSAPSRAKGCFQLGLLASKGKAARKKAKKGAHGRPRGAIERACKSATGSLFWSPPDERHSLDVAPGLQLGPLSCHALEEWRQTVCVSAECDCVHLVGLGPLLAHPTKTTRTEVARTKTMGAKQRNRKQLEEDQAIQAEPRVQRA